MFPTFFCGSPGQRNTCYHRRFALWRLVSLSTERSSTGGVGRVRLPRFPFSLRIVGSRGWRSPSLLPYCLSPHPSTRSPSLSLPTTPPPALPFHPFPPLTPLSTHAFRRSRLSCRPSPPPVAPLGPRASPPRPGVVTCGDAGARGGGGGGAGASA